MYVKASVPESGEPIPGFKHQPFKHQSDFFRNRSRDIILKSPTCSGKTNAILYSFINDYHDTNTSGNGKIKMLYLVPTRLLMQSQMDNVVPVLKENGIRHVLLTPGLSANELFKALFDNDFIISSPDIFYNILLRRKGQSIAGAYEYFVQHLHSVVFDELHLFDTYVLYNLENLVRIIKSIKAAVRIYILSATLSIEKVLDTSIYLIIDGESFTRPVSVQAVHVSPTRSQELLAYLQSLDMSHTVYVSRSVERACRLAEQFEGSALLIGKTWQNDAERRENLDKCMQGCPTFATSVFRQGVDINLQKVLTEEVDDWQDMIQTFGRVGRHDRGEFIVLTESERVLSSLNRGIEVTRKEFEDILRELYAPKEYSELVEMMRAMWYKLYLKTKLKPQVEAVIAPDSEALYQKWHDYLPDVGLREAFPQVQYYEDVSLNLFDVVKRDGAVKYLSPSRDSFFVAVLKDGMRFRERKYRMLKPRDYPVFEIIDQQRFPNTPFFNLHLTLGDIKFKVNAQVDRENKPGFDFKMFKGKRLYYFKPVVFFTETNEG